MKVAAALESVQRMTETLIYSQRVLALRDRADRVRAALSRPDVTTADIMRADFGTDCPKGLDIAAYPSAPLNLGTLEEAPYVQKLNSFQRWYFMQSTAGTGGPFVHLKQNLLEALKGPHSWNILRHVWFMNMLSHETAHRMQTAAAEGGLFEGSGGVPEALLDRKARGGLTDIYRRVGQIAVDAASGAMTWRTVSGYYKKECEMQARLHEVMVTGYAQWERLPVTRKELHAALYNLGCSMPLSMRWNLKKDPEMVKALSDFACSPAITRAVASQVAALNSVMRYAMLPSRRAYMWSDALPLIYGHLLELYGDRPGRARMDAGINPAPAMTLVRVVNGEEALDADRALALAKALPVELTLWAFNQMSYQPTYTDNQRVMAQAFLTYPPTRAVITAPQEKPSGIQEMAPLNRAFMNGNGEAVEMLLRAGCDPLQTVWTMNVFGEPYEMYPFHRQHELLHMQDRILATAEMGRLRGKFNSASYLEIMRQCVTARENALSGVARFYGDDWMKTAPPAMHALVAFSRDRLAAGPAIPTPRVPGQNVTA